MIPECPPGRRQSEHGTRRTQDFAMTALRNATENDIPRITEIYAHYVRTSVATFEEIPPDAAEMTARFRRLTGLGLTWLVGEDDAGV